MENLTRRGAIMAGFTSLLTAAVSSAHAAPASVPVIWDGKKMYESFEKTAPAFLPRVLPGAPKLTSHLIRNAAIAGTCIEGLNPLWIRSSLSFARSLS